MYQPTRPKAKKTAVLLLALAVAMAAAGCRTVTPTDMVPEPIAPAPSSQRFDGSVSVSVTIDARSLRYVRPRQLVSLEELAVLTGLSTQALSDAIATVGDLDLVQIVLESFGPPKFVWKNGRATFQKLGQPEDFGARGVSPASQPSHRSSPPTGRGPMRPGSRTPWSRVSRRAAASRALRRRRETTRWTSGWTSTSPRCRRWAWGPGRRTCWRSGVSPGPATAPSSPAISPKVMAASARAAASPTTGLSQPRSRT